MDLGLPLVAVVGRPNVGKSTLFNRLVGGRPALVDDVPGVTRDRRYGEVEYFGRGFRAVDTGGLDPKAQKDAVGAGIHRQAHAAIAECDAVLFVVDVRAGVNPLDSELADMLRKSNRPLIIAVNKVDGPKQDSLIAEFYELGLGDLYGVSAAHGRGVDALVEAVVAQLPEPAEPEQAVGEGAKRIAFVGKPNAGKSSLVNQLVGVERSLVHDVPGTTTDPVDTPFEFDGESYVLVDTAGMRKRAKVEGRTEQISVSMALGQIRRADIVVLVVDATRGPSEQDQRIARAITESGRAIVIALNKSDLLAGNDTTTLRGQMRDEMQFLDYVPAVLVSALRGDGVSDLMAAVNAAAEQRERRVTTAEINKFFAQVCETHPPPSQKGRAVRVHYMTQAGVRPPTFLLWANHPRYLADSYRRFLVNQLRKRYGFQGTPLRLIVKRKRKARRGEQE